MRQLNFCVPLVVFTVTVNTTKGKQKFKPTTHKSAILN